MLPVICNNYHVASSFCRKLHKRGSSIILVNNKHTTKNRQDVVGLSTERVAEISCAELDELILLSIYRPPDAELNKFLLIVEDALKIVCNKKPVLVGGDFNIDILINSVDKTKILNLFGSFDLYFSFCEPTRITTHSTTCIDNIFLNCKIINKSLVHSLRSDHLGQLISIPAPKSGIKGNNFGVVCRPISERQVNIFIERLFNDIPIYKFKSHECDANELYDILFASLENNFAEIFKPKTVMINSECKFGEWATPSLIRCRNKLYDLLEQKSQSYDVNFITYVKNYSKTFSKVCVTAKALHLSHKIKQSKDKIKETWRIIKRETGKCSKPPKNIKLMVDNVTISTDQDISNTFVSFFTDIPKVTTQGLNSSVEKASSLLLQNVSRSEKIFDFHHVNTESIIKVFKLLNVKKTEDLWGMSVHFLNNIIPFIAPHIALIINKSIDEGIFPDLMKHSKVLPLFKNGSSSDPSNFRPISILPVLSKIFERILLDQMSSYFYRNSLLHKQQFGFTRGRCTIDAGVSLVTSIFDAWERSNDAFGIFCDLSKAFDCVRHDILVLKLQHYGLGHSALKLLKSYLTDRHQTVVINKSKSFASPVNIGVPQGSILGPFLFLVYINDLPFKVEKLTDIVLFADDTSLIFNTKRSSSSAIAQVNNVLAEIHFWFSANNLLLNAKKTKCVKFTLCQHSNNASIVLDNKVLDLVAETVFLGLTVDSKLQWGPHIDTLSSKLSSAAYAVRKIRQLTNISTARLVYFSYFHSVMSYGILLWGGAADAESIFILQKRAIRAVYKLGSRVSLRELFKSINILTMPSLYIYMNIMYVRKNIDHLEKLGDRHTHNTRNKNKIASCKSRLAKVSKSFVGMSIKLYNKLPVDIVNLSDNKFKKTIKAVLTQKAYYKINDYIDDKGAWELGT